MGFFDWIKKTVGGTPSPDDLPRRGDDEPRFRPAGPSRPVPSSPPPAGARAARGPLAPSGFFKAPDGSGQPALLPVNARADALARNRVPLVHDGDGLARHLGVAPGVLKWFIFHPDKHYVRFNLKKRSGGLREIRAPKKRLKQVQRRILKEFLALLDAEPEAHAYIPKRSIVTNAAGHTGQYVVVKLDLRDFFPSVRLRQAVAVFRRMGYSTEVARILGRLCCLDGRVPQGAPTSPALTNLACRRLDRRLAGLARKFACRYSRYADDLTFSGDSRFAGALGRFFRAVRTIASTEGFRIARNKTHVVRRGARQTVTGLTVNVRTNVPRPKVRWLRAVIHNCLTKGPSSQKQKLGVEDPKSYLTGLASFVRMANRTQGDRLLAELAQVNWSR